jgi:hypothetical protein
MPRISKLQNQAAPTGIQPRQVPILYSSILYVFAPVQHLHIGCESRPCHAAADKQMVTDPDPTAQRPTAESWGRPLPLARSTAAGRQLPRTPLLWPPLSRNNAVNRKEDPGVISSFTPTHMCLSCLSMWSTARGRPPTHGRAAREPPALVNLVAVGTAAACGAQSKAKGWRQKAPPNLLRCLLVVPPNDLMR